MEKKIQNFVYWNTEKYISLGTLKIVYCIISYFALMMVAAGIITKSLFALLSIAIWSLLYWSFVLVIHSKHVKKTFALRFLVNGITSVFVSSFCWLFFTCINRVADVPMFEPDFSLWVLLFYFIFNVIYISIIIFRIHKGMYAEKKVKHFGPVAHAIMGFLAVIFSILGRFSRSTKNLLLAHVSVRAINIFVMSSFALFTFAPVLMHTDFLRYYYCKKYGITCDEKGNSTSPKLERQPKFRPPVTPYKKPAKKKIPLILKILIGIAGIIMLIVRLLMICVAVAVIDVLIS